MRSYNVLAFPASMHNRSDIRLQEEDKDEDNLDDPFPKENEMLLSNDSDDDENYETDDDQW